VGVGGAAEAGDEVLAAVDEHQAVVGDAVGHLHHSDEDGGAGVVRALRGYGRTLDKLLYLATAAKGEYSRRIVPANVSIEENQLWPHAHSWLSLPDCPFSCARRKQTKPKSAWGADDPARAAFPFSHGLVLSEAGHEVRIFLLAEATSLMRQATANAILPVSRPPISERLESVARHV